MTYWDNGPVQLYQADARSIPLADQSVHCVVTSPPYFGLRVYTDNDDRGIGLESSVEAYIASMVDVFREVRRVLRDDGVLWLNLGDSYASIGRSERKESPGVGATQAMKSIDRDVVWQSGGGHNFNWSLPGGQRSGDRLGIPEQVVLALQADGWTWRDTIIWAKKSAMPESLAGWRWERCRVKVSEQAIIKQGRYQDELAQASRPAPVGGDATDGNIVEEEKNNDYSRRGYWEATRSIYVAGVSRLREGALPPVAEASIPRAVCVMQSGIDI